MERSAVSSNNGVHRYSLIRSFGHGDRLCFLMLNPSVADATNDDPTVRKCIGFAQRNNYQSLEIVNLFAYRATDPLLLKDLSETLRVGPDNDRYIKEAVSRSSAVVAAWGSPGPKWLWRLVQRRLGSLDAVLCEPFRPSFLCLGKCADGSPRHPLYVKYDTTLVPWRR